MLQTYWNNAQLSDIEKNRLQEIAKKYKKPDVSFNDIKSICVDKQLTDFIEYEKVSDIDLLFISKILMKTISRSCGKFFLVPDHIKFIEYMTKNPRTCLTNRAHEENEIKFINAVLLAHARTPEHLPEIHPIIDNIMHLIWNSVWGPTIASFVAFPVLEGICRAKSTVLNQTGCLISNPKKPVFKGKNKPYKKGYKVSNIKHALQFMEQDINQGLRDILKQLNSEIKLYSRINEERNGLLHGALPRSWESYLVIFLLYAIYISESSILPHEK